MLPSLSKAIGFDLGVQICYSPSRQIEHVRLGGKHWLIYDQYMGQTMALLNRIMVEAEGEEPAIAYFHKYMAERCLQFSRPFAGAHFATLYDELRDVLKLKNVADEARAFYNLIGERFAIFHELGHQILGDQGGDHFRGAIGFLIDELREMSALNADEAMEAFRRGPPAAYHHDDLDTVEREIEAHYSSPEGLRHRALYDRALNDPATFTEIQCDVLAAELIIDASLEGKPSLPLIRMVFASIYIASYHLQTLTWAAVASERALAGRPSPSPAKAPEAGYGSVQLQVRNHCLRRYFIHIFQMRALATGVDEEAAAADANALSIELMEIQKRYYEVIFDPMTKTIDYLSHGPRLRRLEAQVSKRLYKKVRPQRRPQQGDLEKIATIVMQGLTGWLAEGDGPGLTTTPAAPFRQNGIIDFGKAV